MTRREHIIHKTKKMTCGHKQIFLTPVPTYDEVVWCVDCNKSSRILPRKKTQPWTLAEGRPRRLKSKPRSNNQYTKGRSIHQPDSK